MNKYVHKFDALLGKRQRSWQNTQYILKRFAYQKGFARRMSIIVQKGVVLFYFQ